MASSQPFRFALASLIGLTSAAAPLASADISDVRTVTVQIGDIDLNEQSGATTFVERLDAAADQACRRASDNTGRQAVSSRVNAAIEFENCRLDAVQGAASQVDAPLTLAAIQDAFPGATVTVGEPILTNVASDQSF